MFVRYISGLVWRPDKCLLSAAREGSIFSLSQTGISMYRRSWIVPAAAIGLLAFMPAVSAGGLPRGDARAEGFASQTLARIGTMLNDAVSHRQIAAVPHVARKGKVVYLATSGKRDLEKNLPVAEATIYRIASMTKPITSVAVMMLVDEESSGSTILSPNISRNSKRRRPLPPIPRGATSRFSTC